MSAASASAVDRARSRARGATGPGDTGSAAGAAGRRLAEMIDVRGRFHRSVHVARDWDSGLEREFLATPALLSIVEQIVSELGRSGGTRAWTVTGPYGAGKSAFCLFLARLLASPTPGTESARAVRQRCLGAAPPLLPLLIQAERAPLAPAICRAVSAAPRLSLDHRCRRRLERPSDCVDLLLEAAACSEGGVALIVDELGKCLEYAAARPDEDVFLLQQLAEAASRSEKPFLFLAVLHSGFGDYVAAGDPARKAEWQKVQGRFRDIPFSPPAEQLLQLVERAIERRLPPREEQAYRRRFRSLAERPALKKAMAWEGAEASLIGCLPLHPVAALVLWPLFRGKAAQNERSLFAFLSSREPCGFQEFLRSEQVSTQAAPPLYRLSRLYDYVAGALGLAAFAGPDARFWSLINHALERIPASASPTATRVVKCVGLLSLYGEPAGLRPNRQVLQSALDDVDEAELAAALHLLERESIVLFRRHRGCYGLWEGSDVDLEAAFEQGAANLRREPLHRRLRRASSPRPLVARAHYVRTGVLRFFEPRIAAPSVRSRDETLGRPTQADGLLLFLVGDDREAGFAEDGAGDTAVSRALELSRALSHPRPVLAATPGRTLDLGGALDELESWRWVRENVAELAGDPVARAEVAARESAARERFEEVAGRALGLPHHVLDPSLCRWFLDGREIAVRSSRDLQEQLSRICEKSYRKSPPFHNELLNRRDLSAAAARARRELIERIMRDAGRERLGMEGFPAEVSMYESLLVAGGFHRQPHGKSWRICRPTGAWASVWREIEKFVRGARDGQRSLGDLFSKLEAPPFGLRRGPLPVLVAVLLHIRGARLALYEDGLFVPRVEVETMERLVRRPETFSVRTYELSRNERQVIQELAAHEAGAAAGSGAPAAADLLPIVRNLVRVAAEASPYARRTRRLSGAAQAVRRRLLDARDPRQLLLEELPDVLGVRLDTAEGPSEFARALGGAVRELTQALPDLLEEVERRVRETFGFEERGMELRKALRERVRPLAGQSRVRELQLFLGAASRADGRNLAEWRSTIALALGDGLPPEHWDDDLADSLGPRLRTLRLELDELVEVVRVGGDDPAVAVGSIRIRVPGSRERRLAFPCPKGERACAEALLQQWREAASRAGEASPQVQLRALALRADELARELDPGTDEARALFPAERRAS